MEGLDEEDTVRNWQASYSKQNSQEAGSMDRQVATEVVKTANAIERMRFTTRPFSFRLKLGSSQCGTGHLSELIRRVASRLTARPFQRMHSNGLQIAILAAGTERVLPVRQGEDE